MMRLLSVDINIQLWHHYVVRTTLSLDDDVVPVVRSYAESRSLPLGKAVSELVRRALNAPLATKVVNGIHVVVLPPNSPEVTTERIKELENELE
jgi:hypothetical protein